MSATRTTLVLDPRDNVAVALRQLDPGDVVEDGVVAAASIPTEHKVARAPIAAGDAVVKYGEVIGVATAAIATGEHVHVHNVVSARLPGT